VLSEDGTNVKLGADDKNDKKESRKVKNEQATTRRDKQRQEASKATTRSGCADD
jgi:hypothetical protein